MAGAPARVERPPFAGRRVLLGVTGGIAAFKIIGLARELTLAGAAVDVVLTDAAREFVTPLSFEALTGRPVYTALYDAGDPLRHIRLAREADLIVVAPATANSIARFSAGFGDDLLSAILLATGSPVIVCPAMNDQMFAKPQTQRNVAFLAESGYRIVGPADGLLAWGEGSGRGRMEEPETILAHVARLLTGPTLLTGRRVLVTAGPTREALDPVRFLGNRSSGKMGYALASIAWEMGADVRLISGPTSLDSPTGVERILVENAGEMGRSMEAELPEADVLVMAAAVADFRPAAPAEQKIKKNGAAPGSIALEPTADLLKSSRGQRKQGSVVVGFALETENLEQNARRKLQEKDLDLLVLNDAGEPGAGFEVDTNRVALLTRDGSVEDLPLMSKVDVAREILARASALLRS